MFGWDVDSQIKNFVTDSHLMVMNCSSIIRGYGLEIEAPEGAMLTALGPNRRHLLNIVKLAKALVPFLAKVCLILWE